MEIGSEEVIVMDRKEVEKSGRVVVLVFWVEVGVGLEVVRVLDVVDNKTCIKSFFNFSE